MNNKVIIGVIVAALVIGGGWYALSGKGGSMSATPQSMNELLAGTESMECMFTESIDQVETTGTVYVADGLARGDFNSKVVNSDQTIETHFITDGQMINVWTSLLPNQGVAMTVKADPNDPNAQSSQVDFDKKLNYSCKPWAKDVTKFEKPAGITFSSPAELVPPAVDTTGVSDATTSPSTAQ